MEARFISMGRLWNAIAHARLVRFGAGQVRWLRISRCSPVCFTRLQRSQASLRVDSFRRPSAETECDFALLENSEVGITPKGDARRFSIPAIPKEPALGSGAHPEHEAPDCRVGEIEFGPVRAEGDRRQLLLPAHCRVRFVTRTEPLPHNICYRQCWQFVRGNSVQKSHDPNATRAG